jgi:antitoxin MazE
VQKWGNSLAVRIPKAFAEEIGLDRDTPVDLSVEKGSLVLRPSVRDRYELRELVDRVSENNIHREVDYGGPVGGEQW